MLPHLPNAPSRTVTSTPGPARGRGRRAEGGYSFQSESPAPGRAGGQRWAPQRPPTSRAHPLPGGRRQQAQHGHRTRAQTARLSPQPSPRLTAQNSHGLPHCSPGGHHEKDTHTRSVGTSMRSWNRGTNRQLLRVRPGAPRSQKHRGTPHARGRTPPRPLRGPRLAGAAPGGAPWPPPLRRAVTC